MSRRVLSLLAVLGLGVVAGPTSDAALIVTSVDRSITIQSAAFPTDGSNNNTTGTYTDSVTSVVAPIASASQNTNIQALQFSGEGAASTSFSSFGPTDAPFLAQSFFDVFFDITVTNYDFSLNALSLTAGADGGLGNSNFSLSGPGTSVQYAIASPGISVLPGSLPVTGVLAPGSYHLTVQSQFTDNGSQAFFGGSASFNFDITFQAQAVPEPGTMALACIGLVAFGAAPLRRRLKKSAK